MEERSGEMRDREGKRTRSRENDHNGREESEQAFVGSLHALEEVGSEPRNEKVSETERERRGEDESISSSPFDVRKDSNS